MTTEKIFTIWNTHYLKTHFTRSFWKSGTKQGHVRLTVPTRRTGLQVSVWMLMCAIGEWKWKHSNFERSRYVVRIFSSPEPSRRRGIGTAKISPPNKISSIFFNFKLNLQMVTVENLSKPIAGSQVNKTQKSRTTLLEKKWFDRMLFHWSLAPSGKSTDSIVLCTHSFIALLIKGVLCGISNVVCWKSSLKWNVKDSFGWKLEGFLFVSVKFYGWEKQFNWKRSK